VPRALILTLAAALTASLLAPAVTVADEHTASSGPVDVTLSYEQVGDYEYVDLWLNIVRGDTEVYDDWLEIDGCEEPYCIPVSAVSQSDAGLTVRDLDGDSEPEVIADAFTGGAHCCTVSRILRFDGAAYQATEHNWFDAGYQLRDLDSDGRPEFKTADTRFAYKFSAFAFSGFPVRVLTYLAGTFTDSTGEHRQLIRDDARRYKRLYRRALRKQWPSLGLIAAWTADQYRLGRKRDAHRFLRREARAGRLDDGPYYKSGHAFIRQLRKTLRRWDY
jgi:hypothetical protein